MVGRLRGVLLGLEVRAAGRACRCKHNAKHAIAKGELRLVVKGAGPAGGEQGYCGPCGRSMLVAANKTLDSYLEVLKVTNS